MKQTTEEVKRKRGRPFGTKKAVIGKTLWIPAEILEQVQLMIAAIQKKP